MNPTSKRDLEKKLFNEVVRPVVRVVDKVTEMPEPMSHSESERTEEAQRLLAQLTNDDLVKLTTWELQNIEDLREGKATTGVRLRELRDTVRRIHGKKA